MNAAARMQDYVTCAFIVKVTNADADTQAYAARAALRTLHAHRTPAAPDQLVTTCVWLIGEFGDLLLLEGGEGGEDGDAGGDAGEAAWVAPGGRAACAVECVQALAASGRSAQVHSRS